METRRSQLIKPVEDYIPAIASKYSLQEQEISGLKLLLEQEKKRRDPYASQQLPYLIGYSIIGLVLVACLVYSIHKSYTKSQAQREETFQKSQICFHQYEKQQCSLLAKSPQCTTLLSCIKKKPVQNSFFQLIIQAIINSLQTVNSELLGLLTVFMAISLFRIVQVISIRQLKQKN